MCFIVLCIAGKLLANVKLERVSIDLDNIPNRESEDIVAMLTVSDDAMKEKPERLFLR